MEDFKKQTLVGSGIVAGSFLVFWIAASLLFGKIAATSVDIVAERQLASDRSYALNNLSTLKKQAPLADAIQKSLETLLPHEDGLLTFPSFLEGMARVHGLDLSFAFNGQPVAGQPGYILFNASTVGSATNIQAFLNDLEFRSTKFMVNLDSINFVLQGDTYRADLAGKVYFQ